MIFLQFSWFQHANDRMLFSCNLLMSASTETLPSNDYFFLSTDREIKHLFSRRCLQSLTCASFLLLVKVAFTSISSTLSEHSLSFQESVLRVFCLLSCASLCICLLLCCFIASFVLFQWRDELSFREESLSGAISWSMCTVRTHLKLAKSLGPWFTATAFLWFKLSKF